MNPLALVQRGRAAAEALMVDACTVKPVTGESTNPTTGVVTPTYGAAVYAGKCKIQRLRGAFPSNPDAGEHRWTVAPVELHVPVVGTAGIETGHLVTVTSSVDPQNVGRTFRVRSGDRKTFQTAIRYQLDEVVD